jgi:hypothetical protein
MKKYVEGDPNPRNKSKLGEKYYDQFKSQFWERPSKYHVMNYIFIFIF